MVTGYRKVWEDAYGVIPVDEDGRSFEIHHIDGNRNNNVIENLMCVSIQEHFEIHYSQGDYQACALIASRIAGMNPKDLTALVLKEKKHAWQKENRNGVMGNEFTSETATELANERASEGKLPAQMSSKDKSHHWFSAEHSRRVAESNKRVMSKTVTVTDKYGKNKRISTEMFDKQKIGERQDWTYVGVASKEAKQRRGDV